MYLLEVDPLDLGSDIKAVGLELIHPQSREPVRGAEAARVWAAALQALAGAEPWGLDCFSHLERVRQSCGLHAVPFREAAARSLVIPMPETGALAAFFERFEGETFGARAGSGIQSPDTQVEAELAQRGVDGYHAAFSRYFFCAVCDFENGFLTLLSNRLWAGEVARRLTPALKDLTVRVQLPV